jgi:8-oxo-dGTP pyrophosphatase MutT (NUDIX family)
LAKPYFGEKVVTYITQGDRLLIFRHTEHPDAGIQVPAGTVNPGERLDIAAIREAREETGLPEAELELRAMLGDDVVPGDVSNSSVVIRRHFFHFEFTGTAPRRWIHYEHDPSDGTPGSIEFEFTWVRYPDEVPVLAGKQGAMLPRLKIAR